MATKAELLADPNSPWNKAADDETLFILRGVDALAPHAIRKYAKYAQRHGLAFDDYKELMALAKRIERDPNVRLQFTPAGKENP